MVVYSPSGGRINVAIKGFDETAPQYPTIYLIRINTI